MKYIYRMTTDTIYDDEGKEYFTYGIEALNKEGRAIDSVADVFLDKRRAENFVELCNRRKLCVIHLRDAVEDAIAE